MVFPFVTRLAGFVFSKLRRTFNSRLFSYLYATAWLGWKRDSGMAWVGAQNECRLKTIVFTLQPEYAKPEELATLHYVGKQRVTF